MPKPTSCCRALGGYCDRCDLLVGLEGLHVIAVDRDEGSGALTVTVESKPEVMGRPACGVVAHGHGRREVLLASGERLGQAGALAVGNAFVAGAQDVADPVQRVVSVAAMPAGGLLDPAPHVIHHCGGELDDMEPDLGHFWVSGRNASR